MELGGFIPCASVILGLHYDFILRSLTLYCKLGIFLAWRSGAVSLV